jgi:sugar phosphate isomerase/epimerase
MSGSGIKPQDWLVGTSTAMLGERTREDFARVRDAGLQCIEMTMFGAGLDPTETATMGILSNQVEHIKACGLRLWSVHLPFGARWDIATADKEAAERALDNARRFLQLGASWGAEVAVVHPSIEPIADEERTGYLQRSKAALQQLAGAAQSYGIKLAVECLPRTCLCNTSDEMLEVLDAVDGAGACFDANHPLQERPEAFAKKLSGRIATVHISDYDGVDERHWLPGEGTTDWSAVIEALVQGGYPGPFMFEVSRKKGEELRMPADLSACWQRLLKQYLAR